MQRVLLAWLGDTDRKAALGGADGAGPIAPVVLQARFDRVVLLNNRDAAWAKPYVDWLRPQTTAEVEVRRLPLADPTDHELIFNAVRPVLEELKSEGAQLTVHLSPGTPSMHAVWVLLCKTQYAAELIKSSKETGVQTAKIPFDIYAELIPEFLRAPAEVLTRAGLERAPVSAAFSDILHRSQEMAEVIHVAQRLAMWPLDVLIEGESGTGKELFAKAIHDASRRGKAFVPLNCGAIPKDLVEAELFGYEKGAFSGAMTAHDGAFVRADGGTLFLDELGELTLDAQVKLLRAVEQREVQPIKGKLRKVDVRIVAATNRLLPEEIARGAFREDLFYRLTTAVLRLPPLRERRGDVSLLLEHALAAANEMGRKDVPGFYAKELAPSARSFLQSHAWPGNVRELMATVRRAVIWTDGATIRLDDARRALLGTLVRQTVDVLNRDLAPGLDLHKIIEEVVQHYMVRALETTGGVKKDAAKLLGFSNYQTFTNWMKKYRIGDP